MAGQDRPTLFPRWTTDPPAGAPTDITEPTSAQKDSGWQPSGSAEFPDGKPIRQIMNWLQNFAYQWLVWLDQSKHAITDVSEPQVLPITGVVPTLGVGLSVSSGDFSAAVYAGDTEVYRVPLTALGDPPAAGGTYAYSALSDTYWDLRQDGVWIPAVVGNGAGAPAVAANSTRVFAVETDATDRTAILLDNMTGRTHLWLHKALRSIGELAVAGQLEIGAQADDAAPAGSGTPPDFDAFTPRVIGTGRGFSGEILWQEIEFDNESAGILLHRRYMGVLAPNRNQIILVWGARCTGNAGNNWVTDSNSADAFRLVLGGDDIGNFNNFRAESIIGIGTSTTFSESDWRDQGVSGQLSQLEMAHGVRLGAGLNQDVDTSRNSVAHIEHVRDDVQVEYTLVKIDNSGPLPLRWYTTGGFLSLTADAGLKTVNASWNEASGLWNRDDNSKNAHMVAEWEAGTYFLVHFSTDADTWADSLGATTWTEEFLIGAASGLLRGFPASLTGNPLSGGVQYGYGDTRRSRKFFSVIEGQPSPDEYTADARFSINSPVSTVNTGYWPGATPASDVELMIPIRLPHEATIVSASVFGFIATDGLSVGLYRDDTANATEATFWEALQSGGEDVLWTAAATRLFRSIDGLNQNLLIDNGRYRYICSIRNLSGLTNRIWGIRVDYDVPYLSGM